MNYAIDRDSLCKLINDTGKPAAGLYPPGHPYFGTPENYYGYDPYKAHALLKDAGFGPGKPFNAKIMISTSGSGQMLPIPMNELTGRLTRTPLLQANAYARIRRRAAAAGIETKVGNHSYRATTGITAYLKAGGTLENAATMANRASTRTTQLCDRRREEVSLSEVERIRL